MYGIFEGMCSDMSKATGDRSHRYIKNPSVDYNESLHRINQLLEERDWTLYKLAQMSDIPESSLQHLFRRNNEPSIPTLRKICKGLGIKIQDFFSEEPVKVQEVLSPADKQFISRYLSLTDSQKRRLSSYCDGLLKLKEPYEDQ